jgi:hypothetical protein
MLFFISGARVGCTVKYVQYKQKKKKMMMIKKKKKKK